MDHLFGTWRLSATSQRLIDYGGSYMFSKLNWNCAYVWDNLWISKWPQFVPRDVLRFYCRRFTPPFGDQRAYWSDGELTRVLQAEIFSQGHGVFTQIASLFENSTCQSLLQEHSGVVEKYNELPISPLCFYLSILGICKYWILKWILGIDVGYAMA